MLFDMEMLFQAIHAVKELAYPLVSHFLAIRMFVA